MFKNLIKGLFKLFSKMVMSLFYNRKYLQGRWFDDDVQGWIWCWKALIPQKFWGINRHIPWPVSFRNEIGKSENIHFDINDINNFQHFGCYFQSWEGQIFIGKGSYIAPNVGLITQNHDLNNPSIHATAQNIIIGDNCWIGMNVVILPGVILGDNTTVGAGAVVTHSFPNGNIVIGGVPAYEIKKK